MENLDQVDKLVSIISTQFVVYLPKLLLGIVLLLVGWKIVRILTKGLGKLLGKRELDASLKYFLESFVDIILKVALVISVASILGVETTSFIAILGSAGLAIGLAMQGSLSNFAGGVMILLFKPFRVGDFIEAQGHSGTVQSISVFHTFLATPDNKQIIVPNGGLANNSITNFTILPTRRCDFVFGISYGDDIKKARSILQQILDEEICFLKDPAPMIVLGELADSSVNIYFRAWLKTSDYWPTYFRTMEKVKEAFDKNGISIPFPQRDVHLLQEKS
jgi:small conductance mechanosensitive channel